MRELTRVTLFDWKDNNEFGGSLKVNYELENSQNNLKSYKNHDRNHRSFEICEFRFKDLWF